MATATDRWTWRWTIHGRPTTGQGRAAGGGPVGQDEGGRWPGSGGQAGDGREGLHRGTHGKTTSWSVPGGRRTELDDEGENQLVEGTTDRTGRVGGDGRTLGRPVGQRQGRGGRVVGERATSWSGRGGRAGEGKQSPLQRPARPATGWRKAGGRQGGTDGDGQEGRWDGVDHPTPDGRWNKITVQVWYDLW